MTPISSDGALDGPTFFDAIADRYDRTFAPDARTTAADLAPLLAAMARGATVLDVGSGTGRAWPHLVEAGFRVVALDASRAMMAIAMRRSSASSVTRVLADVYARWPIADRSIDALLALHAVFAHPAGDARASWAFVGGEIRRVVREGGIVAIDLPEPNWARAHLEPTSDPTRFVHRDARGAAIEAVVIDPRDVMGAMGFDDARFTTCATGVRAVVVR